MFLFLQCPVPDSFSGAVTRTGPCWCPEKAGPGYAVLAPALPVHRSVPPLSGSFWKSTELRISASCHQIPPTESVSPPQLYPVHHLCFGAGDNCSLANLSKECINDNHPQDVRGPRGSHTAEA